MFEGWICSLSVNLTKPFLEIVSPFTFQIGGFPLLFKNTLTIILSSSFINNSSSTIASPDLASLFTKLEMSDCLLRELKSPPRQMQRAVTMEDFPDPFGPTVTLNLGPGQNVSCLYVMKFCMVILKMEPETVKCCFIPIVFFFIISLVEVNQAII